MAGVAGGLPPDAFYTRTPAAPPTLGRRNLTAPSPPTPAASPPTPAGLTKALTKLTESITMFQSQLSTQATAQAAVIKSLDDIITKL